AGLAETGLDGQVAIGAQRLQVQPPEAAWRGRGAGIDDRHEALGTQIRRACAGLQLLIGIQPWAALHGEVAAVLTRALVMPRRVERLDGHHGTTVLATDA